MSLLTTTVVLAPGTTIARGISTMALGESYDKRYSEQLMHTGDQDSLAGSHIGRSKIRGHQGQPFMETPPS